MHKIKPQKNKTVIITIGLLLCLFIILVAIYIISTLSSPSAIKKPAQNYSETLIVVADIDFEPYSFIGLDGNPTGYDVELAYALSEKLKKNIDLRLMSWNDAMAAIQNKEADLLLGLEYIPKDLPELELSLPLHNDPFVLFGKKNFPNISDLYTKNIAVLEGSGSLPLFIYPYQLEPQVTFYTSYSEAFQSVKDGVNDYVIARYSVGRRALARLGHSKVKAVGSPVASSNFCIGSIAGNVELIQSINASIVELQSEGILTYLSDKWLGKYVEIISFSDFLHRYMIVIIFCLTLFILLFALLFIYYYKQRISIYKEQQAGLSRILEYQQLLTDATKGLYENIYEFDLTHHFTIGDASKQLLSELNLSEYTNYDDLLPIYVNKRIKPEFHKDFLNLFSSSRILSSFNSGTSNFTCEVQLNKPEEGYPWVRFLARLFYLSSDDSIRMILYFQNINDEKLRENNLLYCAQRDLLTQLYNKRTTENLITEILLTFPQNTHAFIILDIDNFKNVNDNFGHDFGDFAITEFASTLMSMFRTSDIVGRIGGDEFVIFLPNISNKNWLLKTADTLIKTLNKTVIIDNLSCTLSASGGISISPECGNDFVSLYKTADKSLYLAKKQGRNCFVLYE